MRRGIRVSLPALAVALALAGCAAPRGAQPPPGYHPAPSASTALSPDLGESPYRQLDGLAEGTILHVPTGVELTRAQFFDLLAGVRVIYVGESHNNIRHHRVQLDILRTLADRFPGKVAVGMEMFQRPSQPDLDRWSRGELDEPAFQTVWYEN